MPNLLSRGEIVVCRSDVAVTSLVVWSSERASFDDDVGTVSINEIMIIVDVKKPSKRALKDLTLTDEWKLGSYKILSSSGVSGWIGAGWVTLA
jgi:hypothetical protein